MARRICRSRSIAINAVKRSDSNWEIEHQCPQCGAPVTLEETDRLLACSYCRTKLYLLPRDYFKYFLPPTHSPLEEVLYVPYWRFRGMVFLCKNHEITSRVNDMSLLATPHAFLPRNLGFRPQALKLRFVSPQMGGRFFSSKIPIKTVLDSAGKEYPFLNTPTISGSIFHRALIGETVSLIYSPIFIQGYRFHDAILGKPVASIPHDFVDDLFPYDPQEDRQINFISTLCPHCGWDLLAERDSVVLLCRNCDSAWEASKAGFQPLDFGVVPSKQNPVFYLPFWKMQITFEGINLQSYADLLRIANVPKVPKPAWEDLKAYFWAPAFKVPPEIFLRLARGLTLFYPEEELEGTLPDTALSPVTLPHGEAVESIKVTLADIVTEKKNILPRLNEIIIQLDHHLLVYLPFYLRGSEFVQSQTQCCIHKNYLKLGRNL